MKPVLSVIVPVYKAEAYLPRCIESILAQTFTDYELLLIDDGSPDDCGRICDEYARKDMRVRVFHQDNKGASAACNLGIDSAFGRYLVFVDSDDWVLPNYLHDLYEDVCAHSGVGLIIHGLMKVDSHKKKLGELVLPDTYLPADRIYEAFGKVRLQKWAIKLVRYMINLFLTHIISVSMKTFISGKICYSCIHICFSVITFIVGM